MFHFLSDRFFLLLLLHLYKYLFVLEQLIDFRDVSWNAIEENWLQNWYSCEINIDVNFPFLFESMKRNRSQFRCVIHCLCLSHSESVKTIWHGMSECRLLYLYIYISLSIHMCIISTHPPPPQQMKSFSHYTAFKRFNQLEEVCVCTIRWIVHKNKKTNPLNKMPHKQFYCDETANNPFVI